MTTTRAGTKRPRSGSSPVTIKTIADHLGVSVTTVARSLKDGDRIGADTVARVRAAAEELGYRRNMQGVKLRTGRSFTILSLLARSSEEEIGDAGSAGLLDGLHDRLAGTDFSLRAVPSGVGEDDMDRLRELVATRSADAVILDHTTPQDARVKLLLEHEMPFVTFGRTELYTPHAWFDVDNAFAAHQATTALVGEGRQRICLLDGETRYMFVRQRREGYRAALGEAGQAFDETLVASIDLEARAARAEAARQIRENGADAFVCTNEIVLLGARAGAHDAGALGKTGFAVRTNTNIAEYLGTPLWATHYARSEAGRRLADLALARLDGQPPEALQQLVRTELKRHEGRP